VVISRTIAGDGEDSDDGIISFQTKQELQRAGPLLDDGVIYIAFASYGDQQPYHGWVIGYRASTLQLVSLFNSTPSSGLGDSGRRARVRPPTRTAMST
jgi:hypothetical protein